MYFLFFSEGINFSMSTSPNFAKKGVFLFADNTGRFVENLKTLVNSNKMPD